MLSAFPCPRPSSRSAPPMATSGCASRSPIPLTRRPFALANVWLNVEVDKESGDGYEKTSTVGGRKIHEKVEQGQQARRSADGRRQTVSWLR